MPTVAHSAIRRGHRGSVVVMVLVMIMVTALLLSRFIEQTTTELFVESRAVQSDRLRAEAASALEVTLAVLADFRAQDGGLRSPAQGWGQPIERAGYEPRRGVNLSVAFEDESGKLSLPRLQAPALQDLGVLIGLKRTDAERFADALLTWTRPEHVPSSIDNDPREYERAEIPHTPPLRPIRSFEELKAISVVRELLFDEDGQPNEAYNQLVKSVSLFDFPASNLNAADPASLALAGFDEKQLKTLQQYLDGRTARPPGTPPFFRSPAEATAVLGATVPLVGLDTEIRCLRIRVTVQEGATALHLTAVVAPPGGAVAVNNAGAPANAPAQTPSQAANVEKPDAAAELQRKLQYPFTILALHETVEPMAPPPS